MTRSARRIDAGRSCRGVVRWRSIGRTSTRRAFHRLAAVLWCGQEGSGLTTSPHRVSRSSSLPTAVFAFPAPTVTFFSYGHTDRTGVCWALTSRRTAAPADGEAVMRLGDAHCRGKLMYSASNAVASLGFSLLLRRPTRHLRHLVLGFRAHGERHCPAPDTVFGCDAILRLWIDIDFQQTGQIWLSSFCARLR